MWSHFFAAGGPGMYPTILFGFALLAAVALLVLRRDRHFERLGLLLGVMTLASGVLGTVIGICKSAHDLSQLPPDRQLAVFALGTEESLHDLVLALIIVLIAGLIATVAALRRRTSVEPMSPR